MRTPGTIGWRSLDSWDLRLLGLAHYIAGWSKDPSTQTGAVLADGDNRVLSVGFNGFPQRMEDKMEWLENREEKYSRIVHCEVNALIHARGPIPRDSTLYTVPFMSCDRCVVQMLQAGILRFVAPKATEEQWVRWGTAFARTRQYIRECGGTLLEVE